MRTGALLLFLVSLYAFVPREWAYDDNGITSARFMLPRLAACAGIMLLAAPLRELRLSKPWLRFDLLAHALALASAGWTVLPMISKDFYLARLALALPLLAGLMMYLHLWRVLARLGNVRFAGQCLAIATVLPVAHIQPFYAPSMQGPAGLGIWFIILTIPAIGPPHLSVPLMTRPIEFITGWFSDPDSPYFFLVYSLPVWASCLLLALSVRFGLAIARWQSKELAKN